MNGMPDVETVIEVAKSLGIHLSPDEALVYHQRLTDQLSALEDFAQSRLPECKPEILYPERALGYRPSVEEDPYNAWMWKCDIGGTDAGLLAGKTVSFKDHVCVAGIPVTFGTYTMEGFIADFDATIVDRVLAAGGKIIGKNTMSGLSGGRGDGGPIGDYGAFLNPHDPTRGTGGSSSGSAAALAAGEVDISYGGDQGGSIRNPAAWCGVFGLKPTFGLVSHFGLSFGTDMSIDFTGPMARTAEDTAIALEAVAGFDGLDPRQDRTVPERMDATTGLADGVEGLKIGILEEALLDTEPEVVDAFMASLDVLANAGAEVIKISIPSYFDCLDSYAALGPEGSRAVFDIGFFGAFAKTYYPASVITAISKINRTQTDRLSPTSKISLIVSEFSRKYFRGAVYAKAQNVRPLFNEVFDDVLTEVDVLATPTRKTVAARHVEGPVSYMDAIRWGVETHTDSNRRAYDYTGHPALSIPVEHGGLPVGLQVIGKFYDDPLLLRIGYAYQHSVDFDKVLAIPSLSPASTRSTPSPSSPRPDGDCHRRSP